MRTWTLVPLKNLARAKNRLAPAVDPALRRALVLAMAEDVLAVLGRVVAIERILLVSNEPEAGSLLRDNHRNGTLEVFYSADSEGLNRELEQAAAYASTRGAGRVLILHADLPWLCPAAVEDFISGCPEGGVRAAQDRLGTGTNAVLAPLPLPIPLVFGVESLPKFRAEAQARGIALQVIDEAALAQDVDRLEDFERLLGALRMGDPPGNATRDLLEGLERQRAGCAG